MEKFEVWLRQDQKTLELKLELKIPLDATIEDLDANWELVERARLIIKQIKNCGFKVAETEE